jgi:hypothetical protein
VNVQGVPEFEGQAGWICWSGAVVLFGQKMGQFLRIRGGGVGAILPNIVSPFRVWHKLWSAGVPVSEAQLSAMGKEASGLAIAPCYQGFPSPGLGVVDQGG